MRNNEIMKILPSAISYLRHQTPNINLFPSEPYDRLWLTNFLPNGSFYTNLAYMGLFFPAEKIAGLCFFGCSLSIIYTENHSFFFLAENM